MIRFAITALTLIGVISALSLYIKFQETSSAYPAH